MRGAPARRAWRLRTKRLVLRCWSPRRDAPLLVAAIAENLEHLRPWMDWAAKEPESLERKTRRLREFRRRFETGTDSLYGVFDPQERAVLGAVGLHRRIGAGAGEIGYWIHRGHVGLGYATEAAAAVVRAAFELERLGRVEIHCDPANLASAAIPRRLGFAHQVTVPRRVISPAARPRDIMIWTLLARDYPASAAAAAAAGIEAFGALGERLL